MARPVDIDRITAGEIIGPLFRRLVELLRDGERHNRTDITTQLVTDGHNPSTVASLIQALARFGLIDRPTNRSRDTGTIQLTTLGAQWLATHHQETPAQ